MEAAVGVIYEKRFRPENLWWPEWHEAQWVKIDRALDAIERTWLSHLEGPVHMGQIAVACALGYLDLRYPDATGARVVPASAWEASFAARPSMTSTAPPTHEIVIAEDAEAVRPASTSAGASSSRNSRSTKPRNGTTRTQLPPISSRSTARHPPRPRA
jgi:hypothetical protein